MVLIDWLVYLIYRFFALPLAVGILKIFSAFLPSKIQEMVADRSFKNLQLLPARPIWIHAASGEIEYAKSVIRTLKEEFPQVPILVTYFSPSAKKLIQKFPGIDLAMALPWDQVSELEKFLKFYQPRICLIARTDVWPELALQNKKRKIPTALFAATFSQESSRKGFLSGSLTRMALNSLSQIFCVSEEDETNLKKLGIRTPIQVRGDTRFDQVIYRLKNPDNFRSELRPQVNDKVFVCGSTWPEDEEVLFEAFESWIFKGGRVILASHEVSAERIAKLEEKIKSRSWSVQRYSSAQKWETSILLVDQIGILQELYSWGNLAFVGGSFKEKVHSVMEPLCVGIPVCVGPHHSNNREALQFQYLRLETDLFAVQCVQNANDLKNTFEKVWNLPKPHPVISQKLRAVSGATDKLISWIDESLLP